MLLGMELRRDLRSYSMLIYLYLAKLSLDFKKKQIIYDLDVKWVAYEFERLRFTLTLSREGRGDFRRSLAGP